MLNKIIDWIEEIICIFCTIVMVTITFANVVCRWTGIGSLAFSEEIATYLFILLSMMGTAIAAKRRAHLGLTILPDAVNFKARKALLVFVYGLCTVFSAAVFYYGVLMVMNQYNLGMVTAAMQWPSGFTPPSSPSARSSSRFASPRLRLRKRKSNPSPPMERRPIEK